MIDSTKVLQHAPYKTAQRIKIETPMGSIESDSGSHIIDGITVIVIILVLYVCKKLVDKYIKK